MGTDQQALAIVDAMLERTRTAIQAKDVEGFIDQFAFPYVLETLHGRNIINSPAEMEGVFWRNVEFYDSIAMTDLVRRAINAEFSDADKIKAVYETTVFQAGNVADRERYLVYTELQSTTKGWCVITSQYAISDSLAHSLALLGAATAASTA